MSIPSQLAIATANVPFVQQLQINVGIEPCIYKLLVQRSTSCGTTSQFLHFVTM